jgi:hypothetical protein
MKQGKRKYPSKKKTKKKQVKATAGRRRKTKTKKTKPTATQKKKVKTKKSQTTATKKKKSKKKVLPVPRILAVAIGGPNNTRTIHDQATLQNPAGPRHYILGMIEYLATRGINLGQHYVIDYQECFEGGQDFTVTPATALILCMSTPLASAADNNPPRIIVAVSSSPASAFGPRVCGVHARRTQSAAAYYDHFRNSVGAGNITLLTKRNSPVSDSCNDDIQARAQALGDGLVPVAEVNSPLGRDPSPAITIAIGGVHTPGLLVLPVDVFFGFAETINTQVAGHHLEVFWPAEEFARPGNPHHFGASQHECGGQLGRQVEFILGHPNTIPNPRWRTVNPH